MQATIDIRINLTIIQNFKIKVKNMKNCDEFILLNCHHRLELQYYE